MNKKSLLYVAATLMLFGCEDYNELNFDGYKDLAVPTDVKSINYTLKKADYTDLFKLAANKEVAASTIKQNEDGSLDSTMYDAFVANAGKNYFTDLVPAELYLPAFLADKWSTATDGSSAIITVNELAEVPELHQQIMAAQPHTLTAADYAIAWEEGEGYEFFCPSYPASKYMNRILKGAFEDAAASDVVAVSYNYAEADPATGNEEEEETKIDKIADVIETGAVESATVQGTVVGTYSRGFLVQDETGTILVYLGVPGNVALGDKVQVAGPTSVYGGFAQFTNAATITRLEKSAFTYPNPTVMSASDMEAYLSAPSIKYVQYDGTLSISGNYVNILIDGSDKVQGSVSYAVPGIVDASLNGQKVTVTGYAIGTSSGKYLNTMATSVVASGTTSEYEPIGVVLGKEKGDYTVCGLVVATYARGCLVTDGTGYILYYAGNETEAVVGDVVAIRGAVTDYAGLKQFGNSAILTVLSKENKVTYPTTHSLAGTDMDAMLTAPAVEYVTYTGTLGISGYYYNVTIDDASTAIGSIPYPAEGLVDPSLNGQKVTVTGYFIGVSSGKYFNTMATSVTAASAAPQRAAAVANTTSVLALYQWDGSGWNALEDVDMIQPAEYTAMGMSSNSISDPATYIPMYLEKNYPYAVNKQETTLAYYNKSNKLVAESYIYNGTEWVNTDLEEGVYNFNLIDGEWVYKTFKCIPVSEVTESGIYVMVADIKVNEETGATEGRLFSPLGENKSYGYMPYATVTINEEGIIEACDAAENAFLTVTAVEDGFTMQDTYGRYIYMKGDYNSFNIGTEIVQPGSSWQFNVNEDGTYSVTNVMNEKVIMYDTQFTSYGCYPAHTETRLFLNVFKMVE